MHNVSDYELYHSFPSRRNSARNSAVCFAWQKIEIPLEKEKGMKAGEKKAGTQVCCIFLLVLLRTSFQVQAGENKSCMVPTL